MSADYLRRPALAGLGVLAAVVLSGVGCGGGSGGAGGSDAGTEAGGDTVTDQRTDADAAPPTDTQVDRGPDRGDTGGDTRADASADAPGTLRLLAGAIGGTGTADGISVAARFSAPVGVASGPDNVYVTDGHAVRRIDIQTGVVTTLAGSPIAPRSGDGPCASAGFNAPTGLAVDGTTALYVADTQNHTIRRIALATCDVTTVAGTAGQAGGTDATGQAARFNAPAALALSGNTLLVADGLNSTIRRVALTTGVVTTVAGTAQMPGSTDATGMAARFGSPSGLALDGAGNLYVADRSNHTIRKVVLATGIVTTHAGVAGMMGSADGAGTAVRFQSPTGIAADGLTNLYVTDAGNQTIRKIALSTGAVSTVAGTVGQAGTVDGIGTAARFAGPGGIAVHLSTEIYVADAQSATIRRVLPDTRDVATVAGAPGMAGGADGTGSGARFRSPMGLAAGAGGDIYVVDTDNHAIRAVGGDTGAVTPVAGMLGMSGSADGVGDVARFLTPQAAVFDGAGHLFVADAGNRTIRQITVATRDVTTLAGTAGMAGSADGTGGAARFDAPAGLALDGAGNLYVSDSSSGAIRKIVIAGGVVTTLALTAAVPVPDAGAGDAADDAGGGGGDGDGGTGAPVVLSRPRGLAFDGAGHLYVAVGGDGTIRRITLATGVVEAVGGGAAAPAPFAAPEALALDAAGANLYVADLTGPVVARIALATGAVTRLVGRVGQAGVALGALPAGLNRPAGIVVLSTGDLVIADRQENAILIADF